jgi:DNA repair exonuclease SbcCD nuclease subunit
MEIPKKFEVNNEDFKIYFDNDKKTHVCENLETGEKTNIGVLGIFLQMGIIKPMEEKTDDKIKIITEKLSSLEMKLDQMAKNVNNVSVKPEEEPEEAVEEEPVVEEKEVQEKPKSEIRDRIMKKVLKQAEEEAEEPEEAVEEEPEDPAVVSESDEEIENWNEI